MNQLKVYKWIQSVTGGWISVNDNMHSGWPSVVTYVDVKKQIDQCIYDK